VGNSRTPVFWSRLDAKRDNPIEANAQLARQHWFLDYPGPPTIEPYKGLAYFREEDAPLFFGRKRFVQELEQAVGNKAFVVVTGPSGSGKSSVVLAGLLPRLRRQGKWAICRFRPGDDPFSNLAGALMPYLEPDMSQAEQLLERNRVAATLNQGQLTLNDICQHILGRQATADRLLLFVDQFEELYAQEINRQDVQSFMSCQKTPGRWSSDWPVGDWS